MPESLEALGYAPSFRSAFEALNEPRLQPARVCEVHRERYTVRTADRMCQADIAGHLRFNLEEPADFPTTGDWVAVEAFADDFVVIHHLLPRATELSRRSVSGRSERQIIGANIDVALIVQSVDRDFNLNRLDRYLAVAYNAKISPHLLLSKRDLASPETLTDIQAAVHERHPNLESSAVTSLAEGGLDALVTILRPGKTYCVLGSSGTGKSTLINALLGEERIATGEISTWNQRGKHTTTHRALFVLPHGAVMIDTPGMRELGATEGGLGLEKTFADIHALATQCRFSNCHHEEEPGCAVLAAIDAGELDPAKFDNYVRMERETAHFEASTAEKRKKAKSQGKLYKRIQREKRSRHYAD